MRRVDDLGADGLRPGEVIALKEVKTGVEIGLELLGRFHAFGHQTHIALAFGLALQGHGHVGRKALNIRLDVAEKRQPGGIQRGGGEGAGRKMKPAFAQRFELGGDLGDAGGVVAIDARHFEHDAIRENDVEMFGLEVFDHAVDEGEFFAEQPLGADVGKGVEQQHAIALGTVLGGRVFGRAAFACEQLVADDLLFAVDDGLARDVCLHDRALCFGRVVVWRGEGAVHGNGKWSLDRCVDASSGPKALA